MMRIAAALLLPLALAGCLERYDVSCKDGRYWPNVIVEVYKEAIYIGGYSSPDVILGLNDCMATKLTDADKKMRRNK